MDATKVELTIKGDVERLALKPTDFLVLTIPQRLKPFEILELAKALAWKTGHPIEKVMVMQDGDKLSVLNQGKKWWKFFL